MFLIPRIFWLEPPIPSYNNSSYVRDFKEISILIHSLRTANSLSYPVNQISISNQVVKMIHCLNTVWHKLKCFRFPAILGLYFDSKPLRSSEIQKLASFCDVINRKKSVTSWFLIKSTSLVGLFLEIVCYKMFYANMFFIPRVFWLERPIPS